MSIAIKGTPYWTRTSVVGDYDGSIEKQNYNGIGIINPRTDVSAEGYNRVAATLVSLANVAPVCVINFQGRESGSLTPLILSCMLGNGAMALNYDNTSVPTGFPTVVNAGSGIYTVTMPTAMTDQFGVSGNVTVRWVEFTARGGTTTPVVATTTIDSAVQMTVRGLTNVASPVVTSNLTYYGVIL